MAQLPIKDLMEVIKQMNANIDAWQKALHEIQLRGNVAGFGVYVDVDPDALWTLFPATISNGNPLINHKLITCQIIRKNVHDRLNCNMPNLASFICEVLNADEKSLKRFNKKIFSHARANLSVPVTASWLSYALSCSRDDIEKLWLEDLCRIDALIYACEWSDIKMTWECKLLRDPYDSIEKLAIAYDLRA